MKNDRTILADLVKKGTQFRNTPIVDDDFPAYRDRFDFALRDAEKHLESQRPEIVCLCGSTRFKDEFAAANFRETLAGKIVLSIGCDTKSDHQLGLTPEIKVKLDELHFRKIDLADKILVLNVGGYIGESTRNEINYAKRIGRQVTYLEPLAAEAQDARVADCMESTHA